MGWLWASRTLSDMGDSIHLLAFNWLLVERSGSAVAVATASTLWLGGQVLAGWPGGRLADRWPPVQVLQGTYLIHGLVIACFAWGVLAQEAPLWSFYVLAFILGILSTPIDPASRTLLQTLFPQRDQLTQANGLFSTGMAVAQTTGPILGGLAFNYLPLGWAFGVNAVSYSLAAIGLLAVRTPVVAMAHEKKKERSSWQEQAHLSLILSDILIPVAAFIWLVAPLFTALLPYLVLKQQGSVLTLGLLQGGLWTGVGLGLGLGAWLVSRVRHCALWGLVYLGGTCLLAGGFALVQSWGAVVLVGGIGLLAGTAYLFLNQVLLDRIDSQNIAGVTGLLGSVLGLGLALSSFLLGWVVQQVPFDLALGVGACVSFLITLGMGIRVWQTGLK
ncbi:MFS transporter [Anthocerotibacter panamensis]|uniref:MFS transporter n=1 Tax=Anthocerotibacter panamensis TaxID=2857077 RepID=UPI001C403E9F|nr:MFS transporter [Anthocerotibacter panamensis]